MKTIKMQGGLGNQLFCLAFAHSVATLTRTRAAVDVAGFASDLYGHGFALGELVRRMGGLDIVSHPLLSHRLTGRLMSLASFSSFVSEGAPPADRAALERLIARGAYFNGYWQNEAYFAEPDTVRDLARVFVCERGGTQGVHDVVIHSRTYKDELRPERRGIPGAEFFSRALDAIARSGAPVVDIVLVSDDPALAMTRLGPIAERVRIAEPAGPYGDMALMMGGRSLILSNSSFSWWGGFCGQAKTVIYPRPEGLFHYPAPAARFTVI